MLREEGGFLLHGVLQGSAIEAVALAGINDELRVREGFLCLFGIPQGHNGILVPVEDQETLDVKQLCFKLSGLHRKEVIQPHLLIRLPCYDLTPIIESTFDSCLLAVSSPASGVPNFHGLTGGVYKARERIHRGMLIRDY